VALTRKVLINNKMRLQHELLCAVGLWHIYAVERGPAVRTPLSYLTQNETINGEGNRD
jgi:hypothetical protein